MKKVLVLGGSGYIGHAIIQTLAKDPQWNLYSTYNSSPSPLDAAKSIKLDLDHLESFIENFKTLSPDITISCMRGDFDLQLRLHHEMADTLKENNGIIYFFSTANVFDQDNSKAHIESDQTCSISPYGFFKINCENRLQEILSDRACIIRLPQVWGKHAPRLNQLKEAELNKSAVTVYPNLYVSTTTDEIISTSVAYLLENDLRGIFHITSSDVVNHKVFYQKLIEALGYDQITLTDAPEEVGNFALASEKNSQMPSCFNSSIEDIISCLCT